MKITYTENNMYTEWVKCPYCHEAIKAPNRIDVTFECPNCGKELLTYSKEEEAKRIKNEKNTRKKRIKRYCIVSLIAAIVLAFFFTDPIPTTRIAGNGPEETKVRTNIIYYLKQHLNNPDSYEAVDFGPSGIYNKKENTYFMLHKYRATNVFSSLITVEHLFVVDQYGNVIKEIDNTEELINDN